MVPVVPTPLVLPPRTLRRVGLPFPLRLRHADERDRKGVKRYLAQRAGRRACLERHLASAASALNALAAARGNGQLEIQPARRISQSQTLPVANDMALRRLGSAVSEAMPQPTESTLCLTGALCELLKCDPLYDNEAACTVVNYDADCIRCLR